ncbi:MAG: hypothetical protein M5U09_09890 [Gammaproteobacteria bacterium]|nr:hypothetical protein [Gammaproteobacteria bacterium]
MRLEMAVVAGLVARDGEYRAGMAANRLHHVLAVLDLFFGFGGIERGDGKRQGSRQDEGAGNTSLHHGIHAPFSTLTETASQRH